MAERKKFMNAKIARIVHKKMNVANELKVIEQPDLIEN